MIMAIPKLRTSFIFFLVLFFSFLFTIITSADSISPDIDLLLRTIKPSLQGNSKNLLLTTWNIFVPVCQWRGLKWSISDGSPLSCDALSSPHRTNVSLYKDPSLHLLSIHLPSADLTGNIPKEISDLSALQSLYLSDNSLSGTMPPELGYASLLSDIDLGHNRLTGVLPPSIWNLCDRLVSLRLHGNSFSGALSEFPNSSACPNLQVLDLGSNTFSGLFPDFIHKFAALKDLDLSDNLFSGSIPSALTALNMEKLNLSHNNFSGALPSFSKFKYGVYAFEGNNPALCGSPFLRSCKRKSGLSPAAIAGMVITFMTGAVVLASISIGYAQVRKRKGLIIEEDELEEEEDENGISDGKLILFQGGEHLTLEDVLNATGQVMEKSKYGTVYKAKLADGGSIALRLLREGSCKDKSSCMTVIKQLGRIRNENLIPLRAYYQGKRGEKLLIYDYLHNTTLHDLLHDTKAAGKTTLSWGRRHKIALGVARGLAHLHSTVEPPLIHGNVRSKNILVDEYFIARLAEYGLDKLMIPALADEVIAVAKADGYKAPELQKMKKCNSRTDVYAFGIVLLEILLGRKPGKNVDLPSIVKAAVLEETTMEVFDQEILKGVRTPSEDGVVQVLKLAMGCCAPVACVRPTMDEVVKQLEENRPRNRSTLYSPSDTRSEIGTPF